MEELKPFQETFRSLEADELDVGYEGKRGIEANSWSFGMSNLKKEQGWGGGREDRVSLVTLNLKYLDETWAPGGVRAGYIDRG